MSIRSRLSELLEILKPGPRRAPDFLFTDLCPDGRLCEVDGKGNVIPRSAEYLAGCQGGSVIIGGIDPWLTLGIVKEPVEPAEIREPDLNPPPGPDVDDVVEYDFKEPNEE